jgi:hypothetical protein
METKGKRPTRGSGTDPDAAETSAPAEAPADAPVFAVAPEPAAAPDSQPAADNPAPDEILGFGREALAAFAESHAAMARGLEAMSEEMAGLTRSGIDMAARSATDMLGVKTISDVFRVNAEYARNSFDSLLDGSAKLSGLGVKLAAESSRPILTQLGQGWINAFRLALLPAEPVAPRVLLA